ncbi:hypothetical protein AK812_SmicGene48210 [Symbiodinium microadriaticum]|uniref:Uncharacterized protein n=1 Tax=Symbiodinium microadriaticum TaxID=2951 RepID=A0A1Q9BQ55_SYMMI|nr:hypothetical protein AK812_SmicGene48210 [Symbiodinium microadriaticum]
MPFRDRGVAPQKLHVGLIPLLWLVLIATFAFVLIVNFVLFECLLAKLFRRSLRNKAKGTTDQASAGCRGASIISVFSIKRPGLKITKGRLCGDFGSVPAAQDVPDVPWSFAPMPTKSAEAPHQTVVRA